MNLEDKGKTPMEHMDNKQLLNDFENIMININEYREVENEKNELFKEIIVDLIADLGKAYEITTHFYRKA